MTNCKQCKEPIQYSLTEMIGKTLKAPKKVSTLSMEQGLCSDCFNAKTSFYNPEADEVSEEDLEAAAEMFDAIAAGLCQSCRQKPGKCNCRFIG